MRRVRIELAYDGTDYAGWQVQPGRATIQSTVEAALSRLHGGAPIALRAAGRTDAGAHARRQVADCLARDDIDDANLAHALGRMLPASIRPLDLVTVAAGFDARRHALAKTYHYRLDRSRRGDPFLARYALHDGRALDLDRIGRALALLPGRRDWSAFTGSACRMQDRVRRLVEARLTQAGPAELCFVFTADGFLTHMVRNLVGTLLEIGHGRLAPEAIAEILLTGDRRRAGPTAPARGLVLDHVRYP